MLFLFYPVLQGLSVCMNKVLNTSCDRHHQSVGEMVNCLLYYGLPPLMACDMWHVSLDGILIDRSIVNICYDMHRSNLQTRAINDAFMQYLSVHTCI
jgi:hypothetical protein